MNQQTQSAESWVTSLLLGMHAYRSWWNCKYWTTKQAFGDSDWLAGDLRWPEPRWRHGGPSGRLRSKGYWCSFGSAVVKHILIISDYIWLYLIISDYIWLYCDCNNVLSCFMKHVVWWLKCYHVRSGRWIKFELVWTFGRTEFPFVAEVFTKLRPWTLRWTAFGNRI